MSTNQSPISGGNINVQGSIVDTKTGSPTPLFQKWTIDIQTRVQNGLNQIGEFIGIVNGLIASTAKIQGRSEGIGTTVQHIDNVGVVQAPGIVAATPTTQGAVILPPAAANNHLGSASISAATDFDPTGSAATAQANAIAAASNAGNITSGTLSPTVIPTPAPTALGGVKAATAAASHFAIGIDTSGNPIFAQPAVTDVLGAAPAASPTFTGPVTQPAPPVVTAATVSTSATAGAATALPATPLGYLSMSVNGTTVKLPYYTP